MLLVFFVSSRNMNGIRFVDYIKYMMFFLTHPFRVLVFVSVIISRYHIHEHDVLAIWVQSVEL